MARFGPTNHHQHQNLESDRACWTKYTLGWSYECWRWDDHYLYHAVDHAIDGARRWEFYVFTDGRWMPRRLRKDETWTLELLDNRLTWYDAQCKPAAAAGRSVPRPSLARGIARRRRRSGSPRRHRARVPAESGARRARNRGALLLREGRRLVSLDSGIGRCPVQPVRRRRAAADAALRARLPAVAADVEHKSQFGIKNLEFGIRTRRPRAFLIPNSEFQITGFMPFYRLSM
jgi:hypothetical protein